MILKANLALVAGLAMILVLLAGVATAVAVSHSDSMAGRYRGTTSDGLPVSFTVGAANNKRARPVTNFSLETKPIQCEKAILPDPFQRFPTESRIYSKTKRPPTAFNVHDVSDFYTSDANFIVDRFVAGTFKKGRFRGYLGINFEWAGPNQQVGRCGTPRPISTCPFPENPDPSCLNAGSTEITWTARRSR